LAETVHFLPLDDLRPHLEAGEWCHCAPRIEYKDGNKVFIHNSYDGREFYEEETRWMIVCPD